MNNYEGKRILFMGDSITALGGWVKRFNEIVKPAHFVNVAVSGATWSDKKSNTIYDGNPVFEGDGGDAMLNVVGNQVEKVRRGFEAGDADYAAFDYIFIAAGTNGGCGESVEWAMEDIPNHFMRADGTPKPLDEVDRTLWPGAMRYTYEHLREVYPDAVIFFCSPVQGAEDTRPYARIEGRGRLMKAICDRISDVVFVDTFNCGICGIYEKRQVNGRDLVDGLHPNGNGAKKIGEYNARALKWYTM
jgi:hypothetical protein